MINDLKTTVGQYEIYLAYLEVIEPERKLYVAISQKAYKRIIAVSGLEIFLQKHPMPFIIIDIQKEEIVQWIN